MSIAQLSILALLPPSFLSYHRRASSAIVTRPRAQSHASLPSARCQTLSPTVPRSVNCAQPSTSPIVPRRTLSSLNQPLNLMSTPPPNRTLARQLKLKGSFTDPAQPRRREAFGPVSLASSHVCPSLMIFRSPHLLAILATATRGQI